MQNPFKTLIEWLSVEDYSRVSRDAGIVAAARFARGNTSIQDHRIVDEAELAQLQKEGARARSRLFG